MSLHSLRSVITWALVGVAGVLSAAAPVIDPKKRLAGAVSVAAPMLRRSVADLPDLAAAARRAAMAIAAEWAGQPGSPQRLATPTW